MLINHSSNDELKKICDDSNCTMFLIDRQHLLIARSKIEIKKTTNFIKIHDIDKTFHDNSKYVELDFYIFEKTSNDIEIIVHFKREMHVINDFRVNVLLKTNILNSKSIIINMNRKFIIFLACENIFVFLNIISKKTRIIRFVKSTIQFIIFVNFCIVVSIKTKNDKLFVDRDYFFHSKKDFRDLKSKKDFFNHITNANFNAIQMKNIFNQFYIFFKNVKIDMF